METENITYRDSAGNDVTKEQYYIDVSRLEAQQLRKNGQSGWAMTLETMADLLEARVTAPADDEREALLTLLRSPLSDAEWQSAEEGKDFSEIATDSILAAGFRRQGPVTDAEVEAAWRTHRDAGYICDRWLIRASLEAARAARA